jgi:hypothetical protein
VTAIPLRMGSLTAPGFIVRRSGIRWLCEDGHLCRPGEVIAFCNIGLTPDGPPKPGPAPFADEARDFQIAFAPRVGGRLRKAANTSHGGFIDQHYYYLRWTPDFIIGHLEHPEGVQSVDGDTDGEVRLLMLAGRRTTELAEDRSGLLTGWHDRTRAWWGDGDGRRGTVLSLGICELLGVIRGERSAFTELFEAVPGPAQAVFVPDDALVPCAAIVSEQLNRTSAQSQALAEDFARSFGAGAATPTPGDWMFAGALLSALQRSPLTEQYEILTRTGLRQAGPPDAVILSLNAESPVILRHRRLGYALNCHAFRIADAGPALRTWLQTDFEPVKRTPDEIHRDYLELIDAVGARSGMKVLILNVMSTSGNEEIQSYAPFDRPMGDVLSSIRNKELNLMLHDLARQRDVSIIDVDAMAAALGEAAHLPDGVHNSGPMQAEVRREILRILRARGISGFAATPVR